jgi:hypothetical protein
MRQRDRGGDSVTEFALANFGETSARADLEAWETFGLLEAETALAFYRDRRGDVWALPVSHLANRPDFGMSTETLEAYAESVAAEVDHLIGAVDSGAWERGEGID